MYLCVINKKMEENFDIREQQLTTKERDFENALRPLNFEDFSGQDKVVDNLRIFVKAARLRAEALDHVLLHGPPGLGKTTLSNIIANPDYVGKNAKDDSIEFTKEYYINGEYVKVAVRISTHNIYYARSMYVLNPKRVKNFIAKGTLKNLTNK